MFDLDNACDVLFVTSGHCYEHCEPAFEVAQKKNGFCFSEFLNNVEELRQNKEKAFGRAGGKLAYVCTLAATLHSQFALTCVCISFTGCLDIHVYLSPVIPSR